MHNIATPELPDTVKTARDEFIQEQQREQQREQRSKQRDISKNPDQQRPTIQLKTPRAAQLKAIVPKNGESGDKTSTKQPVKK